MPSSNPAHANVVSQSERRATSRVWVGASLIVEGYHNRSAVAAKPHIDSVPSDDPSCWPVRPSLNVAGTTFSTNCPAGDVRHRVLRPQLVGQGVDGQDGVATTVVTPGPNV